MRSPPEREHAGAVLVKQVRVGRVGILDRLLRVPPQVGEHDQALVGVHQRRDVLRGVTRRFDQADRRRQLEPLGLAVDPEVVAVPRPVVVDPGLREQGGVQRVIGVVVREHHVGDLLGGDLHLGERTQDRVPPGDQSGVDDDHDTVLPSEADRRRRAILGVGAAQVALEQDPNLSAHRPCFSFGWVRCPRYAGPPPGGPDDTPRTHERVNVSSSSWGCAERTPTGRCRSGSTDRIGAVLGVETIRPTAVGRRPSARAGRPSPFGPRSTCRAGPP